MIYSFLLLFLAFTYFRLAYTVTTNPGFIPRGPQWHAQNKGRRKHRRTGKVASEHLDAEKYSGTAGSGSSDAHSGLDRNLAVSPYGNLATVYGPSGDDPSAPGLQGFYNMDAFICESDGRPIWCSTCLNWKPDRTHHCREVGRCVRKMDHFCPWHVAF